MGSTWYGKIINIYVKSDDIFVYICCFFSAGNDDGIFQIDGISGIISLEKKPVSEQYILKIKVSDSGTPVLTATTDVTINVDDSKFIYLTNKSVLLCYLSYSTNVSKIYFILK